MIARYVKEGTFVFTRSTQATRGLWESYILKAPDVLLVSWIAARAITKSKVCSNLAAKMIAQKTVLLEQLQKHRSLLSTGGGTRTHMRLPSPDFESGASANSATPA